MGKSWIWVCIWARFGPLCFLFYPICSSFLLRWDEQRTLASAVGWAEKLYWCFGEKPSFLEQSFWCIWLKNIRLWMYSKSIQSYCGDSSIMSGKMILTVDFCRCCLHFRICVLASSIFPYSQPFPAFSYWWGSNMQFCLWVAVGTLMLGPFIITGHSFQQLVMLNLCWTWYYVGLCYISTPLTEPLVSRLPSVL